MILPSPRFMLPSALLVLSSSSSFVWTSHAFVLTSGIAFHQQPRHSRTVQHATSTKQSSSSSSASTFQGAGDVNVDMNQYNLPLDDIAQEWTAVLMMESSLREEGVYLAAKSEKEIMVDTVTVAFPRILGQGLGIELLEIAGGREDGLGITVVNGVVDGSPADGSDLLPGDSIAGIAIQKAAKTVTSDDAQGITQVEEMDSVYTECYGYDKTVDAILSLPAQETENETVVVTVKRLRRKPKVTINLQYPPAMEEPDMRLELFAGENLRRAMLTRGVKLNDPLSERFDSGGMGDCGAEGTCATCVVSITSGMGLLNPAKTQEEQILRRRPLYRMACKAIVGYGFQEGEMTIRVNPRQWDDA